MAVNRIYCATGLIGGTDGDLDTIDGANLADKDMAIVIDSDTNTVYFYKMNVSGAVVEDAVNYTVIVPDDNSDGGNKNWELSSMYVNDITIRDDIILAVDDVAIGDTLTVTGTSEFKGAVQIGDANGTGANLTIYSDTADDHIVFDKTAKTFTFTDITLAAGALTADSAQITAIGGVTPGSIIGTTIDASTDFTIGSLVITDGVITDATGIQLAGNVSITGTLETGGKLTAGANEIEGSNFDINGGAIDGVTIGAASAPTVTNLGSVTTCDINGGTIDGVTIGATTPPTVTNLGSVTTCDINGGSIDGATLGAASACTFTSLTAANVGQISWGDGIPDSDGQASGDTIEVDVDQNTVGAGGCLVLSSDGSFDDADVSGVATVGMLVIAVDSGTGTKTVMTRGFFTETGWSWTPGAQLYVGTSGAITSSIPTGSGEFLQVVGYALTATTIYFNPSSDFMEIA